MEAHFCHIKNPPQEVIIMTLKLKKDFFFLSHKFFTSSATYLGPDRGGSSLSREVIIFIQYI